MEELELAQALRAVRERGPLVQCITNIVTVNDCANIILAAGGSATMAHHVLEVEEAVAAVQALVLNLGAPDCGEAMILAGRRANALGIPVVLDPVAVGVTTLRRQLAARLLDEVRLTVIRGNASEIKALARGGSSGSGVGRGGWGCGQRDLSGWGRGAGGEPVPAHRRGNGALRTDRHRQQRDTDRRFAQRFAHHGPHHRQRLYAYRTHRCFLRRAASGAFPGCLRRGGGHGCVRRAGGGAAAGKRHRQRHLPQ